MYTETFQAKENLSLENSFGVIRAEDYVDLTITIGINSDTYGWFELYDNKTGGDEWYAEGGLWFENRELRDYDGVFCLPMALLKKLEEMGYDVSEMYV